MNTALHKAITDLGILERMKGRDSTEAVEMRWMLEDLLQKADPSRRGMFTMFRERRPAVESPREAPTGNLPAVISHTSSASNPPANPSPGETDLSPHPLVARAANLLNTPVSRRTVNRQIATTGVKMAAHQLIGTGPKLTATATAAPPTSPLDAAREHAIATRDAWHNYFFTAPYHPQDVNREKHWKNLDALAEAHNEAHEKYQALIPGKEMRIEDHPHFHDEVKKMADKEWESHQKGQTISHPGHDRSEAIVPGRHLRGETDLEGDPIDPKGLYSHDWNDTGEIARIRNPEDLADTLKGQMWGGRIKSGANRKDVKYWLGDEMNYTV